VLEIKTNTQIVPKNFKDNVLYIGEKEKKNLSN